MIDGFNCIYQKLFKAVEARAIFAWELGLRKIILESDFPGGYAGFSKPHHSPGFHPTADHRCKIFAANFIHTERATMVPTF